MKGLLKFLTCGSVDDGKSTLIGHLLYDSKLLFADQEQTLKLESKVGSRGGKIDYSLLLDGLMAEREQGITIDVAYRYFTTEARSFIVADTPGHEEYTRNMAVGASFADLAIVLIDVTKGILRQTIRHSRICALMGIRHFVFAVNKMDLVGYDKDRFRRLEKDIKKLAIDLDLERITVIPVSATEGDNITRMSPNMKWYKGKALLDFLETVDVDDAGLEEGFVMPVQRVCRPDRSFRGFAGEITSGQASVGDTLTVLPSRQEAKISSILITDREAQEARMGQAVTISLDREVDVSRGSVLVSHTDLFVSRMFTASILWMDDQRLTEGKSYLIKIGAQKLPATIMNIKYKLDIETGEHISVKQLNKNELAECDIALTGNAVIDRFSNHRALGEFILIDRVSNMTSACGVVLHSLRRSENVVWQKTDITREHRAAKMKQKPVTLWFTGLSGAGKSTLANEIEKQMFAQGHYTMLLDGDNIRMGINKNLGFEEKDRTENIRRVAEVSKLMNDAGLIVLTAFISPYISDRQNARDIIGTDNFIEIYVSTPLEECEKRDVKGLYKKARDGQIPNFTGIGSPYQPPEHPEITIDTTRYTIEESAEYIMDALNKYI